LVDDKSPIIYNFYPTSWKPDALERAETWDCLPFGGEWFYAADALLGRKWKFGEDWSPPLSIWLSFAKDTKRYVGLEWAYADADSIYQAGTYRWLAKPE
jgi:hypothetical protein